MLFPDPRLWQGISACELISARLSGSIAKHIQMIQVFWVARPVPVFKVVSTSNTQQSERKGFTAERVSRSDLGDRSPA